jgi:uncharacterized protein (TIGR00297 family)
MNRFALGAAFAGAIAVTAFRSKSLTAGGALAACGVGTVTFGALGLPGASVLLTFFGTSVALSRLGRARKRTVLVDVEKQAARDAMQVFANGGVAALCAALTLTGKRRFATAFAGAFAAAAADTWGTEIGTLSKRPPRSILTLRPIATGLSGGVTLLGSGAQFAGALTVAAVAAAVIRPRAFATIAIAGAAGAVADSILGASVQSLRWCAACGRATERNVHDCGDETRLSRGLPFIGNDAVNFAATLCGALIGYALAPA